MATSIRNKTWRQEQKQQFGHRITWARKRAGFNRAINAFRKVQELKRDIVLRTYYAHESGERVPDDEATIDVYCAVYRVSRDFLLFGTGPELKEYLKDHPTEDGSPINQAPEQIASKASQFGLVRYIPILTASELRTLLSGQGTLTDMSSEQFPVPQQFAAGPNSFTYQIPEDDQSMVGDGPTTLPPGTFVIVDPDQDIMPGKHCLAWPAGWPAPVARKLQAAFPFQPADPRYPFKLLATNANFDPITVAGEDDCKVLGRIVLTLQAT